MKNQGATLASLNLNSVKIINIVILNIVNTMNRKEILLASFTVSGGDAYQPVQIQKLVFLFQEKALKERIYNFTPYNYGPFDSEIYVTLEKRVPGPRSIC